jgi:cell division protein FtsW
MASNLEFLRTRFSNMLHGDKVIWLVISFIALGSVLVVYSSAEALSSRHATATSGSFLLKHVALLVFSLFVMYGMHLVNHTRFARWSTILLTFVVIPLLIYTLLMGVNINDARRWIRIPFVGVTVQSSDFAKIVLIAYVARTLALMQERVVPLSELTMPVLVVCGLIAPADLSTSVTLFFTCVLLMMVGKVPLRDVFSLFMLGVGLFSTLIILSDWLPSIRVDTWANRLYDFVNGDNKISDQVEQAQMAIAKGGFIGLGPGNGTQAHFLPNAYSDYIYCIIVEEYGFVGAAVIVLLYATLLIRCIRLVTRSPKIFGAMLSAGLGLGIIVQAFIHMAVNVNLLPVTGLTLPFMSMGGTSLMFTGIALGIILNVSRQTEAAALENK